jgi:hypothetical protein
VLLNTTPVLALSSTNLGLGTQATGTIGTSRTVTVTNTGVDPLQVRLARVTGGDSDDFIVSTDTCSDEDVPAGETCTVGVRFIPTATGARSSALRIVSNALGSARTVTLTGTATATAVPAAVAGPQGPAGSTGPRGTRGATGQNASVTCRLRAGAGAGARLRCTVHLTRAARRHLSRVLLTRNGTVFASGRARRGSTAVRLVNKRRLRAGRYTLILVKTGAAGRRAATRSTVYVG